MGMDYVGTGATITFGTSALVFEILDFQPYSLSRESVNTSHQGTSDWHTKAMKDLVDGGQTTFTCHYKPGLDVSTALTTASETVTITFADGETTSFSGALANYTPNYPHQDKPTVDVTVEVLGQPTISS